MLLAHRFGLGGCGDFASLEGEVAHLHLAAVLAAANQIAAAGGQRGDGGGIGARTADSQLFELLHQGSLGIAVRRLGELALGLELACHGSVALGNLRKDCAAFIFGCVVHTFGIELEEAVEQHAGTPDDELLRAVADGSGDFGVLHPGRRHLRCHGALPDELVELLFLRVAAYRSVLDVGGTYGFVRLLGALAVRFELARVGVFRAELVDDELLRRAQRECGKVRGVRTHIGDETLFVETLGDAHGNVHRHAQLARRFLLKR